MSTERNLYYLLKYPCSLCLLCVLCALLFYMRVRNSGRPHETPKYSPVRSERVPGVM